MEKELKPTKMCPQYGKPIETPVPRKIIQRDNRAPRGIRENVIEFCSDRCGGYYQMGCEG